MLKQLADTTNKFIEIHHQLTLTGSIGSVYHESNLAKCIDNGTQTDIQRNAPYAWWHCDVCGVLFPPAKENILLNLNSLESTKSEF